MKALDLDFFPAPWLAPWVAAMLLAAAGACAAVATFDYLDARRQSDRLDSELAGGPQQAQRVAVTPHRSTDELAEEIERANAVVTRLNIPWARLFSALESGRSDRIALTAIEPDAAKRTVRISAECKTLADIADYLESLGTQGVLEDVVLVEHQRQQHDPTGPLRFTVTARWKELREP